MSQDTPDLPADEGDIVLEADGGDFVPEEEMELTPEFVSFELDGEASEEGTAELAQ